MDNDDLRRISRYLYFMLNCIIGFPDEIDIRRTTTNLRDDILRMTCESSNIDRVPCFSGSKCEGLRFNSSDDDWMFIYQDIKVIPYESMTYVYNSNTTLLLMENEMTKPGFTLGVHQDFIHGPCSSGSCGGKEYDVAYCLKCDIWPKNAYDCVKRLHQCDWPSNDKVLSIIKDGVLFVPIGAKQSMFENTEWRMSFSLAEKKLIYAMNHTQFICYALLKIFLKEAKDANPDVKGLLCSYFLKTALFWEITARVNQWNPESLLSCFWNCLRRLLQWISCSYCPNFFIPQNNMFEGKIEATNQIKLLEHLRILYYEGCSCLLRCQSISDYNIQFNLFLGLDVVSVSFPMFFIKRLDRDLITRRNSHGCIAKQIVLEYYTEILLCPIDMNYVSNRKWILRWLVPLV